MAKKQPQDTYEAINDALGSAPFGGEALRAKFEEDPGYRQAAVAHYTGDPMKNMSFADQLMTQYPGFRSSIDSQSGLLDKRYQLQNPGAIDVGQVGGWNNVQLQNADLNQQGLEEIRRRALSGESSPWANIAQSQADLMGQRGREEADRQGASSLAQAQSQLAQTGGLSSGAAERLAGQSMRDMAMRRQQERQGLMSQKLGINLQDAQGRDQMLTQLPGLELGRSGFLQGQNNAQSELSFRNQSQQSAIDQFNKNLAFQQADSNRRAQMDTDRFNIGNTLAEQQAGRQYDMTKFGQIASAQAAQEQAKATRGATKK
jgi:hypothetical protein